MKESKAKLEEERGKVRGACFMFEEVQINKKKREEGREKKCLIQLLVSLLYFEI